MQVAQNSRPRQPWDRAATLKRLEVAHWKSSNLNFAAQTTTGREALRASGPSSSIFSHSRAHP